jgi:hypothetical protein
MVDQAQITCTTEKPTSPTPTSETRSQGRTELPPQAVARNSASFLGDFATLAELQGKLLVVDLREGTNKLIFSLVLLVAGTVIALGCVPVALAALALLIGELTNLTPAACFGIALLVGLVLAGALAVPGLFAVKKGLWMFDRSQTEWRKNVQWFKDTIRRAGGGSSCPPAGATRRW